VVINIYAYAKIKNKSLNKINIIYQNERILLINVGIRKILIRSRSRSVTGDRRRITSADPNGYKPFGQCDKKRILFNLILVI
jgi:hypothetical protein